MKNIITYCNYGKDLKLLMTHLKNYEILTSKNLHEMQGILTELTTPTAIDIIGKGQEIDASLRSASFGGLDLMHVTYGDVSTHVSTAVHDENALLLFMLTDGKANVKHNGKEFDISPTTGLMRDSRLPLVAHQEQFSSFGVPLPIDDLKRQAAALLGEECNGLDLSFDPELDLSTPSGQHFRNTIHYINGALDGPLHGSNNPIVLDSLRDLLLSNILSLLPNSYSDLLRDEASIKSSIVPIHVKRARDYIHAHAATSITLETLATHAGCGYRTLQVAFNDAFGMSPMAYVRSIRLTYAHDDLGRADVGVSVRDIALKWGFTHMGWFSKCYMAKFDTLPSKTLRSGG